MCLYMVATTNISFIKFFVGVVPDSDPSFWPLTALHELHVTMQPLFDRLGGTHPHYSKEAHKWLLFGILGDFWTYRSLCDQILEKLESGLPTLSAHTWRRPICDASKAKKVKRRPTHADQTSADVASPLHMRGLHTSGLGPTDEEGFMKVQIYNMCE